MMPDESAIRTWLWMQAMNYLCTDIWRSCKRQVEPDDNARIRMKFDDLLEKSYRYAIDHWDDVIRQMSSHSGTYSGHSHFSLGYDITRDCRGVVAEYRSIKVNISFPDVRKFILRLLDPPQIEERQMTMLEIMLAYRR